MNSFKIDKKGMFARVRNKDITARAGEFSYLTSEQINLFSQVLYCSVL